MAIATRLGPLLRKSSGEGIPLQELLAQMDAYDWDLIEDMPTNEGEWRQRLEHFNRVIGASGVEMNSSILDLASGVTSLAYLYPEAVAADNDPQKIKMLRKDGIKGILADIESLPFEERSFDYVVSISPPQKSIILPKNSCSRFDIDQEYNKRLVNAMLRIARKNVLVGSYFIFRHPPFGHLIEKRDAINGFYTDYYVLYRASNNSV